MFLVTLIACSKDSEDLSTDFNPKSSTSTRSANDLRISYDMATSQNIKPTTGSIEDLCALDIKMLTIPNSNSTVTTTLDANGNVCFRIIDLTNERRHPEKGREVSKTITDYCNGQLTYTDSDGTVTSIDTETDLALFQSIFESYFFNETQKDSAMNVMILEAERAGAKVTKKGNALTIISVDADGNTSTTVYDMKNHVMVASTTVDEKGNLISKTTLGYKCDIDGKIVPDYAISYSYKDNMICSDPIYSIEQVKFENFKTSI